MAGLSRAADVSAGSAAVGAEVVVFYPSGKHGGGDPEVTTTGLGDVTVHDGPGDTSFITAPTAEPAWSMSIAGSEG